MNENARNSDRGTGDDHGGHDSAIVSMTSRGLSDLAASALARLNNSHFAGDLSEDAKACMKFPLASALATALCDDSSDIADLMVFDLIDAGLSVQDVCLDHLAPAARCLGEWWETDRLPFTEVTMATSRIQSILRKMPSSLTHRGGSGARGVVFCAVPGEQHTLGVMMAAELFRRLDWDVGLLLGLDHPEMIARLARDDRRVIGLSCSGDHSAAALERLMIALRKRRPDARIVLSGGIVKDEDALARLPRPDAVVTCMEEAEACLSELAGDVNVGAVRAASIA
jgi:methylmalonyl-CoA mutase cobalamin-binding subunit